MKTLRLLTLIVASSLLASLAPAQVPPLISYQGRVAVGGTNFNGSGQFKFALVNNNGSATFWSNNGSSAAGSEPSAAVALSVANGLYSVLLGDATLPNMTAIPTSVFNNTDVRLRVWFNDGVNGSQLLTPDQRIASVGYAMIAANVPDGSITAGKLAPGVLNPTNLPPNSVGSDQLANTIALGTTNLTGRLDVYRTAAGTPGVSIFGGSSQISTYGSDGLEQIRLWGGSYGELLLNNSLANNATAVRLSAQGTTGGQLELRNTNGAVRALLEGENTGGQLTLYQADGATGVFIDGDSGGAGYVSVRGTNGLTRASLDGSDDGGGTLRLMESDGTETISATSQGNGVIVLRQGDGSAGLAISANNGTGGGGLTVYRDNGTFAGQLTVGGTSGFLGVANSSGNNRVYAQGSNPSGSQGGYLGLINSAGSQTITLDASDGSGDGRITTQVLQITGGSDLSEQFDITALHDELKAGLIVSIDPEQPGHLMTSSRAYDKTVAGIISGAGGVQPGMLMGQRGTAADGKHAVALTGRVYCWVDAGKGAIRPGDLITTSDTPGHGMKVKDHRKAQGAVIGKAMSSLEQGKGLVLVLVSMQ
jgi:hypothetical protein